MIKICDLTKIYITDTASVTALENVNLEVKKGEIFGIIGLSGAGKSTLIRCLNLLETPTSGSIRIDGQEITTCRGEELRRLRSSLGMIFQHFNLLMQRTVAENVAFPLEIAKTPRSEIKARVAELLQLVGLTEKTKTYPAQLSGGQKQRVAIARALANNPKVLLCDEATSALDPLTTRSILALLKDINQKLNLTIVLITHEMGVVKEICHKVAVIDSNHIVEQGSVMELISNPQTEAARKLFSPVLQEPEEQWVTITVRLTAEAGRQLVISNLVRLFDVDVNILLGVNDNIHRPAGEELVLELSGKQVSVANAVAYLSQLRLSFEVIGK
jgi:D-methionine transport system ATP-binding protein